RISPNNAASLEDCSSSTVASSSTTRGVPQENESLGEFLRSYSLNHRSFTVKPRGLSNRSNWCFANAILQALLGCRPSSTSS
ncbi:Ubiquitin specific peptidase 10, partial [Caligus rogercresseyi]